jgi:uncharacterized protein (UPF0261 family)
LNKDPSVIKILVPLQGWSEADREGGPLYDPPMNRFFTEYLKERLSPEIEFQDVDLHINDAEFGEIAAQVMDAMVRQK